MGKPSRNASGVKTVSLSTNRYGLGVVVSDDGDDDGVVDDVDDDVDDNVDESHWEFQKSIITPWTKMVL